MYSTAPTPVDRNVLLQMLTALPPGETVDYLALNLQPNTTSPGLPTVTNISPSAALRVLDNQACDFELELISGINRLDTLAAVASSEHMATNSFWASWAVNLNPLSAHLRTLPPLPSDITYPAGGMYYISRLLPTALARRDHTPETRAVLNRLLNVLDPQELVDILKRLWPFGRAPFPTTFLTAAVVDLWRESTDVLYLSEGARDRAINLYRSGLVRHQLNYVRALVADPTDRSSGLLLQELSRPAGSPYVSLERVVPMVGWAAPWLGKLLLSDSPSVWRLLICHSEVPVAGRILGRELFTLVGNDLGAWVTALETLDTWEGSIPEWLELQEGLR